ncbi:Protein kinase domain and Serine/threonine-/dual specificity protein kinase, catalytic domain and Protein kinase-like domain-containing protein [Strongyloides ratti]|uniref:Protein kinase domain and Serine/threonine-/dual specificity protein kinase, catalytic domain and Protein kinase-like domain-containing protein n=1 Tax=Strongyloides ratti TaxID=34506 RepID=A0A090MV63_STRRB|nr:Protein kinase domain and Serine/threonine-/dual specificity protein kinase, catalytic domain and Protein kinase-like domain-containing protein [Strongyloides ratti]CEF62668.1 Protein kinase domain and Serine/threonine-/dual specificity protein kinase, catalytic domain and Protein kinase-like domain-containing protein [Strongyloides ratti]
MIVFHEDEDFNRHLEDIRQIRHKNIEGGPIIFYNEYFITLNLQTEQRLLFVYKESDGISLSEILYVDNNFFKKNTTSALQLLKQIGDGLLYLHRRNIVHGEIHPDNIVLTKTGIYKLINCCFFHILSHLKPQNKLREMKCLYYNSPESIFTEKIITKEEDVWAFGIIIYNLYNGFDEYYFKNLHPMYQTEPDACLIHMFKNYGPFCGQQNDMPNVFYNICAGGIWKRNIERVNMKVLMQLINSIEYCYKVQNFICNEKYLYYEIISRISSNKEDYLYLYRYLVWREFIDKTDKKGPDQKSGSFYPIQNEKQKKGMSKKKEKGSKTTKKKSSKKKKEIKSAKTDYNDVNFNDDL